MIRRLIRAARAFVRAFRREWAYRGRYVVRVDGRRLEYAGNDGAAALRAYKAAQTRPEVKLVEVEDDGRNRGRWRR